LESTNVRLSDLVRYSVDCRENEKPLVIVQTRLESDVERLAERLSREPDTSQSIPNCPGRFYGFITEIDGYDLRVIHRMVERSP
jgi:hypothetical protein